MCYSLQMVVMWPTRWGGFLISDTTELAAAFHLPYSCSYFYVRTSSKRAAETLTKPVPLSHHIPFQPKALKNLVRTETYLKHICTLHIIDCDMSVTSLLPNAVICLYHFYITALLGLSLLRNVSYVPVISVKGSAVQHFKSNSSSHQLSFVSIFTQEAKLGIVASLPASVWCVITEQHRCVKHVRQSWRCFSPALALTIFLPPGAAVAKSTWTQTEKPVKAATEEQHVQEENAIRLQFTSKQSSCSHLESAVTANQLALPIWWLLLVWITAA